MPEELNAQQLPQETQRPTEQQHAETKVSAPVAHWNLTTRVAFRFCFVFLGVHIATFNLWAVIPFTDFITTSTHRFWQAVVPWVGAHILGIQYPILLEGTGSGDRTFDWVRAFSILVIAMASTIIWSVLDRRRENYVALHKWFRLAARFSLAVTMIGYGVAKAVPLQMPYPSLTKLLEPFGNLSPMGVLWASVGASRGYEIFTGCAELVGGIFLIFPRTATFGALISLADMIEVFMLNMWYDVPVKLYAFLNIALALVLVAPDGPRLANVLFMNRAAAPSSQPQLFRGRIANRIALGVQVALGIYLIGAGFYGGMQQWRTSGGGRPKSPLYGIWNVDEMSVDGKDIPPLLTDGVRWRRIVFDIPTAASFQRMDESYQGYGTEINMGAKSLTLTKGNNKSWKAAYSFQQPTADTMLLDGEVDRHKIHMQLKLFDRAQFLLVSRGFHWIQERPFNR